MRIFVTNEKGAFTNFFVDDWWGGCPLLLCRVNIAATVYVEMATTELDISVAPIMACVYRELKRLTLEGWLLCVSSLCHLQRLSQRNTDFFMDFAIKSSAQNN